MFFSENISFLEFCLQQKKLHLSIKSDEVADFFKFIYQYRTL